MGKKPIVQEVELARISESKDSQDLGDIKGLAASMQADGLQQPVGLVKNGDKYEPVWGRRRIAAARELGWQTITARVYEDLAEADKERLRVVENTQRLDYSPMEEAEAVKKALADAIKEQDRDWLKGMELLVREAAFRLKAHSLAQSIAPDADGFPYDDETLIREARRSIIRIPNRHVVEILTALAFRFEQARKGQAELSVRIEELEKALSDCADCACIELDYPHLKKSGRLDKYIFCDEAFKNAKAVLRVEGEGKEKTDES